jgi:hypothetical protein
VHLLSGGIIGCYKSNEINQNLTNNQSMADPEIASAFFPLRKDVHA